MWSSAASTDTSCQSLGTEGDVGDSLAPVLLLGVLGESGPLPADDAQLIPVRAVVRINAVVAIVLEVVMGKTLEQSPAQTWRRVGPYCLLCKGVRPVPRLSPREGR